MSTAIQKIEHPAVVALRQRHLDAETEASLGAIELGVLTSFSLADAIREGSSVTPRAVGNYGRNGQACALSAALLAARARGYA